MATSEVRCPGCACRMKLPAGAAGRAFRCPKCQQSFRIPAAERSATSAAMPAAPPPTGEPVVGGSPIGFPGLPPTAGVSRRPAVAAGTDPPLRPFLVQLGIGLAALSGLLVVLAGIGLLYEPVALAVVVMAAAAGVGLALAARLWLIVMAFRDNATSGLLMLLVPLYDAVYIARRRGLALRPVAMFCTAFVPLLLGLGMLGLYRPIYTAAGRMEARAARSAAMADNLEAMIYEAEQRLSPGGDVQTAEFPVFGGVRDRPAMVQQADAVLRPMQYYVPGSFKLSEDGRRASLQHRGDANLASRYRLLVSLRTELKLGG